MIFDGEFVDEKSEKGAVDLNKSGVLYCYE